MIEENIEEKLSEIGRTGKENTERRKEISEREKTRQESMRK